MIDRKPHSPHDQYCGRRRQHQHYFIQRNPGDSISPMMWPGKEIPVPIDPEEEARASSIYAEEESYNQRRLPTIVAQTISPRNGQNERPSPRPALIESEESQPTPRDEDRPVQRNEPRRFPRDEPQPAKRERVQVILKGDSAREVDDDSRELEDSPGKCLLQRKWRCCLRV